MLRKKLAIFFFALSQVVFLGHDVVSHHHHEDLTIATLQDHHSDEEEKIDLETLFSGIKHIGDQITFTNVKTNKITTNVICQTSSPILLFNGFLIQDNFTYYQHFFPPLGNLPYKSPLYGTFLHRGPPFFVVI